MELLNAFGDFRFLACFFLPSPNSQEPETCNAFPEPVKPVTQPEPVAETRVEAGKVVGRH